MLQDFWNHTNLFKRLYDRTLEPVCMQYGITRMELDILLFLANNPQFDTAADIISRRRLTKSHVSSSLKLLEEKHFLEKVCYEGNRKTLHLCLLPSSSEIIAQGQEAQKKVAGIIFQSFTPQEIQMIADSFSKMAENMRLSLEEMDSQP